MEYIQTVEANEVYKASDTLNSTAMYCFFSLQSILDSKKHRNGLEYVTNFISMHFVIFYTQFRRNQIFMVFLQMRTIKIQLNYH